jgi:hypothetical protein
MYSFNNDYHSRGKAEKEMFRAKVIESMSITKKAFYAWLMRDSIPKKKREKFAKIILNKENLE